MGRVKLLLSGLLLGLIKSDDGDCKLFGKTPKQASSIWNDVGYLVETPHAYPNLSVIENLEVIYKLRGLKDKAVINNILDRLQLMRYKNTKETNLSLGNKQRLGLAKALIHKPRLLILDEPINGLDPAGIVEIRELLKELAENHTTIFLSSHILSEIAKLTTRIGIIHQGSIIKEMISSELKSELIIKLQIDTNENERAERLLQERKYNTNIHEGIIEVYDQNAINSPEDIATLLVENKIPPKKLTVFEEDLEHYFLRTIKEHTL